MDKLITKLLQFLGTLSQVPGLDGLEGLISKLQKMRYDVNAARHQVDDAIGDIQDAKESGEDLLGISDAEAEIDAAEAADRTVLKAPADDGGDRTLLRPRPGGRRGAPQTRVAAAATVTARAVVTSPVRGSGLNPLVDAATELLSLVGRLRQTVSHPDVGGLRGHLVQAIKGFDTQARSQGMSDNTVLIARYSLCTLVDEAVLTTPWGSESRWSERSLLSQFHNETWGGEKFFVALDHALKAPARNRSLLELMYLCIALGLEGKFRVLADGRNRIATVRDNLFRTLRQVSGEFERELSPRWKGVEGKRKRLSRYVPLWAVAALAGALLLGIYLGYLFSIGKTTEPVYVELSKIGQDARLLAPSAPIKRTLTLREVLANDIKAKLVDVLEQTRGSTIEIFGDGLFASGSVEIRSEVLPVIGRIAEALNQFPGPIIITGHTDNQALGLAARARFPTNWHLSQARADAVAAVLAQKLTEKNRIKSEGRADTEPKAPNDTPEHRARNRRVEITLLGSATITETLPVGGTEMAP
jgi:type VI secretion system protein ImpK